MPARHMANRHRAVAVVAPYYYRPSAESIYAYFREIARNTPST